MSAGEEVAAPPIQPVPRTGDLPLSFAQQRLWFVDQLAQGSGFYNSPHPIRFRGNLDVPAFARTLAEIVRRHEVLRTSLPTVGGRPVQRIAPPRASTLPLVDLGGLAEPLRESELVRLMEEDGRLPFDLARGPLLRLALLRLGAADHVVFFTMHHVVGDGWSMGVLVREVSALYPAFREGLPSPLPELPIQYADFAVWQRSYLTGEVLEEQLAYWRQRLGGLLPVLDLPTDRPRQAVQTHRGTVEVQVFPAELCPRLKQISQSHGATLFMTLLAAFVALLHRTSGEDDILVGTAMAGRTRVETEGLIGFFINMLPLRIDLSQNPSFLQLLARTREAALGAFTHQDIPLEKLIEEIQPEREGSRTPFFDVAFGFRSEEGYRLDLPDLKLEPLLLEASAVRLDLSLWAMERDGTLAANWFFNTDLFGPATIRRWLGRYEAVLASVAANPEALLSMLEIHGEEEKQAIAEAEAKRLETDFTQRKSRRGRGIAVAGGG